MKREYWIVFVDGKCFGRIDCVGRNKYVATWADGREIGPFDHRGGALRAFDFENAKTSIYTSDTHCMNPACRPKLSWSERNLNYTGYGMCEECWVGCCDICDEVTS
jgi:hypothetical protein